MILRYPGPQLLFSALACLISQPAFGGPQSPPPDGCPAPTSLDSERWPGQRQWQALQAAGFRVGKISVQVDDVYDTPPAEQRWYERAANAVHINSSQRAIRAALTIASGDAADAHRIYQAERNLRALPYLLDAWIKPLACRGDTVDVLIHVHDAWTLSLSAGVSSVGGESHSHLRLEDENFLGTGKTITLDRTDDAERISEKFRYHDPNLFASHWKFTATHESLSDGDGNFATLEYPFRTFDQNWAVLASSGDSASTLYFYDLGERAWVASSTIEEHDLQVRRLLSFRDDSGWRAGLGWRYEKHRYFNPRELHPGVLPEPGLADRRLSGAYLVLEYFHEHYASFRNIRAMDRNEDYNLGFNFGLTLGNYSENTGSNENALYTSANMTYGSRLRGNGLLLVDGNYSTRRKNGELHAEDGDISATTYVRRTANASVVARLKYNWLNDPDPDQQLYVGGIQGLYGYPEYFRRGEASWQSHLEYRYTTKRVLFRTLRVGLSAFLQAAQVKRPDGHWSNTYSDIGVAFRFGNLRGSHSDAIYVGAALPLVRDGYTDSWQLLITSDIEF